jgi:hypothetical protein
MNERLKETEASPERSAGVNFLENHPADEKDKETNCEKVIDDTDF